MLRLPPDRQPWSYRRPALPVLAMLALAAVVTGAATTAAAALALLSGPHAAALVGDVGVGAAVVLVAAAHVPRRRG